MLQTFAAHTLSFFAAVSAPERPGSTTKDAPCVWFLTDLIGMPVVSEQGDRLGQVEDVLVRAGGDPAYFVLSYDAWFGAEERRFALPWGVLRASGAEAMRKDSARSFLLRLEPERLRAAPAFDASTWPSLANTEWTRDVDAYYAGDGARAGAVTAPITSADRASGSTADGSPARPPPLTWRATELRGLALATPRGDRLGELVQIALDARGRVSFATVAVGPVDVFRTSTAAVPWDSLVFALAGNDAEHLVVSLDATISKLELAPARTAGRPPGVEYCDAPWIARLYEYFRCAPYWSNGRERMATPRLPSAEHADRTPEHRSSREQGPKDV
ncbi:MAG: PRC-barrel domain-containing protein [Planctomycetes bacterium]|nr:PRC-barrel domain-containing protein [Planctomycetota bacterium]